MRSAARKERRGGRVRRQRTRGPRRTPRIEIMVASPLWNSEPDAKALVRRAIAAAAAAVATSDGELAVVLTDDKAIRALNRDWRQKDAATNVLSFPAGTAPAGTSHAGRGAPRLLGDIVIAYETTKREARAASKPFAHHLTHLAVHGFLHLVGFDHATDEEAEKMESMETAILAGLDVPDPYVTRVARG